MNKAVFFGFDLILVQLKVQTPQKRSRCPNGAIPCTGCALFLWQTCGICLQMPRACVPSCYIASSKKLDDWTIVSREGDKK